MQIKALYLLVLILFVTPLVSAQEHSRLYMSPRASVGFNAVQGTAFLIGADLGYALSENWAVGLQGYYSAGEKPKFDREYGFGPFVSFVKPWSESVTLFARQEINNVNLRNPRVQANGNGTFTTTSQEEQGLASSTLFGASLRFTDNFGVSLGYRHVLGLTNPDLDNGRSGVFFGFLVGI